MTTILFFEGSYQFLSETTHLNVSEEYIQYKLAKQYEYRTTNETLWAEIIHVDGVTERFTLDYENNKLNKHA